jgi:hypothetical protein
MINGRISAMPNGKAKFADGKWTESESGAWIGEFNTTKEYRSAKAYLATHNNVQLDAHELVTTIVIKEPDAKATLLALMIGRTGDEVNYPRPLNQLLDGTREKKGEIVQAIEAFKTTFGDESIPEKDINNLVQPIVDGHGKDHALAHIRQQAQKRAPDTETQKKEPAGMGVRALKIQTNLLQNRPSHIALKNRREGVGEQQNLLNKDGSINTEQFMNGKSDDSSRSR